MRTEVLGFENFVFIAIAQDDIQPCASVFQEKATFILKEELHPSAELTSKLVSSMPPSSVEEGCCKVAFSGWQWGYPSRYAPPPPLHPSPPPRGMVSVGFQGCCVAVQTRRGALRAPVFVGK